MNRNIKTTREEGLKRVIIDTICFKMGEVLNLYEKNRRINPDKIAEEGYRWIKKGIKEYCGDCGEA